MGVGEAPIALTAERARLNESSDPMAVWPTLSRPGPHPPPPSGLRQASALTPAWTQAVPPRRLKPGEHVLHGGPAWLTGGIRPSF